jgi:hypothetical protein
MHPTQPSAPRVIENDDAVGSAVSIEARGEGILTVPA